MLTVTAFSLAACLQHQSCDTCLSSDLTFNCSWCHVLQRFVPRLTLGFLPAECGGGAEGSTAPLLSSGLIPTRGHVWPVHSGHRTRTSQVSCSLGFWLIKVTVWQGSCAHVKLLKDRSEIPATAAPSSYLGRVGSS